VLCGPYYQPLGEFSGEPPTEEEKETMPAAWVQIVEDLNKKRLAIVFKLE